MSKAVSGEFAEGIAHDVAVHEQARATLRDDRHSSPIMAGLFTGFVVCSAIFFLLPDSASPLWARIVMGVAAVWVVVACIFQCTSIVGCGRPSTSSWPDTMPAPDDGSQSESAGCVGASLYRVARTFFLAVGFCAAASGCAVPQPRAGSDWPAAIHAAIQAIESLPDNASREKLIYVVGEDIDPDAKAALARLRTVIAQDELQASDVASLPAAFLVVSKVSMSGDSALFSAWQGPMEADTLFGCGLHVTVNLAREDGVWRAPSMGVSQC